MLKRDALELYQMNLNNEFSIAFLLTAYENVSNINRFISQVLLFENSFVFIHIDKNSSINKEFIISNPRVNIMKKRYKVEWGDYSQIESVLELMKYAKSFGNFNYYSLHSESDMLVRPINDLVEFLAQGNVYAYTWCYPLPYNKWQYGGGLGRIAMFWPKIFRKKYKWSSPFRYLRSIYGKMYTINIIKGKKLPAEIKFWGRSDWFTLSEKCVKDILNYLSIHPEYNELFKNSLIGSEIFFTTLVHINGNKNTVSDNNLRYIDFENQDYRKPGSPKELDISDINSINNSGKFFARKFNEANDLNVIEYYMYLTSTDKQRIKAGKSEL